MKELNRKIVLVIVIAFVIIIMEALTLIIIRNHQNPAEKQFEGPLMEYEEYKVITPDNIQKIDINRYTEGGNSVTTLDKQEDIQSTYNSLSKIKIGKETEQACEDNTTGYVFTLKDGKTISIQIECDWVIIKNKHYMIK